MFSGTKLTNDVELLSEKVKNISLNVKDDKFKLEEKILKLSNQGDLIQQFKEDLDRKVGGVTATQSKLEKSAASVDDNLRTCSKDILSLKHDMVSVKSNIDKCVKNVEENTGNIFGCKQDFDLLKDNLGKNKIVYLSMIGPPESNLIFVFIDTF